MTGTRRRPCGLRADAPAPGPCCRRPASGGCPRRCGSSGAGRLQLRPRSGSGRSCRRPRRTPARAGLAPAFGPACCGGAAASRRTPPAALPAGAVWADRPRARRAGSGRVRLRQKTPARSAPGLAVPADWPESAGSRRRADGANNWRWPRLVTPSAHRPARPTARWVPAGPRRHATASFWRWPPADPAPARPACAPIAR